MWKKDCSNSLGFSSLCILSKALKEDIWVHLHVCFLIWVLTVKVLSRCCFYKMAVFLFFVETELAAKDYRANHYRIKTATQHTFRPLSLLERQTWHYKLSSPQTWMSALSVLQSCYWTLLVLTGPPGACLLPLVPDESEHREQKDSWKQWTKGGKQ